MIINILRVHEKSSLNEFMRLSEPSDEVKFIETLKKFDIFKHGEQIDIVSAYSSRITAVQVLPDPKILRLNGVNFALLKPGYYQIDVAEVNYDLNTLSIVSI